MKRPWFASFNAVNKIVKLLVFLSNNTLAPGWRIFHAGAKTGRIENG
jgi:hypothetical protein